MYKRQEHTLFIITTDGMENASRFYSSDRVKQMIERQKAKYDWEFLFFGANIDAVETAVSYTHLDVYKRQVPGDQAQPIYFHKRKPERTDAADCLCS